MAEIVEYTVEELKAAQRLAQVRVQKLVLYGEHPYWAKCELDRINWLLKERDA